MLSLASVSHLYPYNLIGEYMANSITGFSISTTGNSMEYAVTVTNVYALLHPQETIAMTITASTATVTAISLCSAGPDSLINLPFTTCIGGGTSSLTAVCRVLFCLAPVPTDLVGLPVTVTAAVALDGQVFLYNDSILFGTSSIVSATKTIASSPSSTKTATSSSSFAKTTQTTITNTTIPLAATSSPQSTSTAVPSTAALVGGIVGCAFALFALVFVWLTLRRRMRRVRPREEKTIARIEDSQVTSVSAGGAAGGGSDPVLYDSMSGTVTPQRSILSGGRDRSGGFQNDGVAFLVPQQQQQQQQSQQGQYGGYFGKGYFQPGVLPVSASIDRIAPVVPMPVHLVMIQSQQLQPQQLYPGYYDGFGQYHYYTAEELVAMQ
ncbi:hypothetical protein HK100_001052 [Physocladia obscura]|uniref:Transmembrane protein n=1 Tax=Physocladia obscura TaxID=109957 RepID=A0AAD5SXN3_9FUNG|nr:hypothetical protein HK100_001052 [Physocladia obscura]